MSAYAIVTGALFRFPESRVSKAGKPYVTATLKGKDGETAQFWRVTAFSETAQAELLRLSDGEALSVQGALRAELYRPEGGEARVSLSIIADHVLALRPPSRNREKKADNRASGPRRAAVPDHDLDDAIPF